MAREHYEWQDENILTGDTRGTTPAGEEDISMQYENAGDLSESERDLSSQEENLDEDNLSQTENDEGGDEEYADASEFEEDEEDEPEFLRVSFFGEEKKLNRAETEKLVLRGMGWKELAKKAEELEKGAARGEEALRFVTELAREAGMEPSGYINRLRVERLVNAGLPRAAAQRQVDLEDRLRRAEGSPELLAEERRREGYRRFLKEYPGVSPEDVPGEVWQEVKGGADLTSAYAAYKSKTLQAELETLKKEMLNRRISTMSRHSSGDARPRDPFLDGFEEY